MPHRAVAIANAFLNMPGAMGALTQMQLQKLAYIASGWNMAINGEPLVNEDPQAWDYGPVFPDLYDHTKYFGSRPLNRLITADDDNPFRFFSERQEGAAEPYKADLTEREAAVIDHVWRRYGALSGARLSALTHQPNTPWSNAYARGRNSLLDRDEIREHYVTMAQRAQRSAEL